MRRSLLLFSCCFVVALLAGCGSKGPLFAPPPKPVLVQPVVLPAAATSSAVPVANQH